MSGMEHTPESELVARLRDAVELNRHYETLRELCRDAAATIERLDSELRLCRAALLAERMCADILENGAEERPHSAHELTAPDLKYLRAISSETYANFGTDPDARKACDRLAELGYCRVIEDGPAWRVMQSPDQMRLAIRALTPAPSAHEQGRREAIEMLQEAREHVALRLDGMERIGATAEAKRSARSLLQRMDAALAKEGTP